MRWAVPPPPSPKSGPRKGYGTWRCVHCKQKREEGELWWGTDKGWLWQPECKTCQPYAPRSDIPLRFPLPPFRDSSPGMPPRTSPGSSPRLGQAGRPLSQPPPRLSLAATGGGLSPPPTVCGRGGTAPARSPLGGRLSPLQLPHTPRSPPRTPRSPPHTPRPPPVATGGTSPGGASSQVSPQAETQILTIGSGCCSHGTVASPSPPRSPYALAQETYLARRELDSRSLRRGRAQRQHGFGADSPSSRSQPFRAADTPAHGDAGPGGAATPRVSAAKRGGGGDLGAFAHAGGFSPKLDRVMMRRLLQETNMTRTELYRLFNRFKALCQLSGTPGSINKATFKDGVSSLAFEDATFVDRVFALLDEDGARELPSPQTSHLPPPAPPPRARARLSCGA